MSFFQLNLLDYRQSIKVVLTILLNTHLD